MAYPIASGQAISTAAYTKSANLFTGKNIVLGKGRLQLWAKGSAVGMNITLNVGGVALMDDMQVPSIGTTGTLSTNDNAVIDQVISGGLAEFYLRNTTAGALTTDYLVNFTPVK